MVLSVFGQRLRHLLYMVPKRRVFQTETAIIIKNANNVKLINELRFGGDYNGDMLDELNNLLKDKPVWTLDNGYDPFGYSWYNYIDEK